jgi:hypothetical protein
MGSELLSAQLKKLKAATGSSSGSVILSQAAVGGVFHAISGIHPGVSDESKNQAIALCLSHRNMGPMMALLES